VPHGNTKRRHCRLNGRSIGRHHKRGDFPVNDYIYRGLFKSKHAVMKWMTVLLLVSHFYMLEAQDGKAYVKMMYVKNAGKWNPTLSFLQTTKVYRHDSLIRTSEWLEAIKFPYQFRIDTDTATGSGVIFTRDSTYRFKNGELQRVSAGGNPFTFSLGGMYFMAFDAVLAEFSRTGYDLTKGYRTNWKGKETFVIGNTENDSSGNSLWIDAANLYGVRTIEYDQGRRIDAQMEGHIKLGNAWSETKVNIFINGALAQVEEYRDLSGERKLDDALFNIHAFGKKYWITKEKK
jgi:hypothetical protein